MRWQNYKKGDVIGWRPWFAWHPVVIGSEKVWLEWVERRSELRKRFLEGTHWEHTHRFPA